MRPGKVIFCTAERCLEILCLAPVSTSLVSWHRCTLHMNCRLRCEKRISTKRLTKGHLYICFSCGNDVTLEEFSSEGVSFGLLKQLQSVYNAHHVIRGIFVTLRLPDLQHRFNPEVWGWKEEVVMEISLKALLSCIMGGVRTKYEGVKSRTS